MIIALLETGTVNLPRWIPYFPSRGCYAQSKQRRISRWLKNSRINIHRLYREIMQSALSSWQETEMYLSLDTSLFWDEYCLIRLALIHRGRAIPVSWRVLKHGSSSVAYATYQDMLTQAKQCLPDDTKVILLADRGFIHTDLMRQLTLDLEWHYRIRLKKDCWIWRSGKGLCQLCDFHFNPGEALAFHNVRLHKDEQYGPVHIVFGRNNVNGEFWAIVSDEPTTLQTFCEYGLRFDIEENFLDDQSNGWNIQKSQIRDVCALSRLWFILALATLYVTAQGLTVVNEKRRRWVDSHWFRGNSYFRIGWEWIRAALFNRWPIIDAIQLRGNDDAFPVMASRLQHEKRLYRLEFQIQTFSFSTD